MAEALLKLRGGGRFEVHSAGFNPQPVMPAVVEAMAEMDIDISDKQPTDVEKYIGKTYFGYVMSSAREKSWIAQEPSRCLANS